MLELSNISNFIGRHRAKHELLPSPALDMIPFGFCVFDHREQLVICNKPYLTMYNLPPSIVRRGCDVATLLAHRAKAGTLDRDPAEYRATLATLISQGKPTAVEMILPDGRIIEIANRPMPDGGWMAIHEDVSERRKTDQSLPATDHAKQRQICLEEAIVLLRGQSEASLTAISENTAAMKTVAKALLTHSGETTSSAGLALEKSHNVLSAVTATSSAARELVPSIAEINRQLTMTADAVRQAAGEAEQANVEISELADAGKKIGNIVKQIQNIASQTNLLALNATIEAAHAGAAGKGFSVVASEVKLLAMQTSKATDDIGRQIDAVKKSSEIAVHAIERLTKRMREIDQFTTGVASSMQQQDSATSDISRGASITEGGVNTVVAMLDGVTNDALKTSKSAKNVLNATNGVDIAVVELRENVEAFLRKAASEKVTG